MRDAVKAPIHMNLYSIATIKQLLTKYEMVPNDRLGQNFLVQSSVAQTMLKTAQVANTDTVLEAGPGIGTLTKELAERAKKIVAVEKDPDLVEILKETLREISNVKVVRGDILTTRLLLPKKYRVVASLPYYLTSRFIRFFLERPDKPVSMTLLVQKEVAQRMCAKPPDMSLLAVSVQFFSSAQLVAPVRKTAFWPMPKVDSAVVHIVPRQPEAHPQSFFTVVKAGFSQPRKQLGNTIASGLHVAKQEAKSLLRNAGIEPARRAETLSLQEWLRLADALV